MDYKKLIGTIIGVTLFAVLIAGATFAWLTFGTTVIETNVTTSNSMNFLVDYTQGQAITNLPMLDSNLAKPEEAAMLSVTAKKHNNSVDGHLAIMLTNNATTGKKQGVTADLLTDGIVRWAICRGTPCSGSFVNAENAGIAQGVGTPQVLLNDAALADSHDVTNGNRLCEVANDLKTMTVSNVAKPTGSGTFKNTSIGNTGTYIQPEFSYDKYTGYSVCNGLTRIVAYGTETENKTNFGGSINYLIGGASGTETTTYYIYFWLDGATINNNHKEQTYSGYIHAAASQLKQ